MTEITHTEKELEKIDHSQIDNGPFTTIAMMIVAAIALVAIVLAVDGQGKFAGNKTRASRHETPE